MINLNLNYKYVLISSLGVSDVQTMRDLLKDYVATEIFQHTTSKPDRMNAAFYPSDRTIENHMYVATTKHKLSCMDQVRLQKKIDEWMQEDSQRKFHFRPYRIIDGGEENLQNDIKCDDKRTSKSIEFNPHEIRSKQFQQKLLYVHQEAWQRNLLQKYGNNICLMDATYKTTKYVLPLFFVIVNTNAGYKIAGKSS